MAARREVVGSGTRPADEPLRSYEDVNGLVPRALPLFDSAGLAQQTSGPHPDDFGGGAGGAGSAPLAAAGPSAEVMAMFEQRFRDTEDSSDDDTNEPQRMVSGADVPLFIDPPALLMMSNVGPDIMPGIMSSTAGGFAAAAAQGAAERLAHGFAADGAVGGPFSEQSPPPGRQFGGYLKGNTGIVWKAAAGPSATVLNRVMFEILPRGDVEGMKRLLQSGKVGPDLRIGKGPTAQRTLLHWAVARGQRPLVELLIERGADTSLMDGQGQTATDLFSPSEGLPALPF